jgi:hypothetical protein
LNAGRSFFRLVNLVVNLGGDGGGD